MNFPFKLILNPNKEVNLFSGTHTEFIETRLLVLFGIGDADPIYRGLTKKLKTAIEWSIELKKEIAMKKIFVIALVSWAVLILLNAPGCKTSSDKPTLDELEQSRLEAEQAAEEAAKAAEQKPPPPPKMNEDVYVEITARSVLIRDKYKDDSTRAEKEVEAVYEKFGVTFMEYKDFQDKLTPQRLGELQRKINDFIQKIINEYR
jgi:hypothetical protein